MFCSYSFAVPITEVFVCLVCSYGNHVVLITCYGMGSSSAWQDCILSFHPFNNNKKSVFQLAQKLKVVMALTRGGASPVRGV